MADVFEDRSDLVRERARLFELMDRTPYLDWLLLTKRPENIARLAGQLYGSSGFYDFAGSMPNVWLGVTVEDQEQANKRIPLLAEISATVRFLSCEPLLGPVDLAYAAFMFADSLGSLAGIDWVICGGESGPRCRPMQPVWALWMRDQCVAAGVPFFFKQWGGRLAKRNGRELDGQTWDGLPVIRPAKGWKPSVDEDCVKRYTPELLALLAEWTPPVPLGWAHEAVDSEGRAGSLASSRRI
jgi:protein gp37